MEMGHYINLPVDEGNNCLEKRVNCCSGGSKIYRLVGVSFGLLCIIQSALNVSLRIQGSGLYNKSDHINSTIVPLTSTANISAQLLEKGQLAEENMKLLADKNNLTRDNKMLMDQLKQKEKEITELQTEKESLISSLSVMVSGIQNCPQGWHQHKSSCYYLSTERKSWAMANRDCTVRGAHLMILNEALKEDILSAYGSIATWIGLRAEQNGQLKTWTWVDGSQLTYTDETKLLPDDRYVYCAYAALYTGILNFVPADCRVHCYWVCEKKLK